MLLICNDVCEFYGISYFGFPAVKLLEFSGLKIKDMTYFCLRKIYRRNIPIRMFQVCTAVSFIAGIEDT